ncbi:MAG: thioesterase family protein [Alistipes sp.]|nr:thioesterase family protein [Alistipes sp.]
MIETPIQMRFADVDSLGHVNNVNQQHYFDLGKNDYMLQVLDLEPQRREQGVIIVAMQTQYKSQIRFHEPIVIQTSVQAVGHKSFTLLHRIIQRESGEVKTECSVVMVAFDFVAQHSIALPEPWRQRLEADLAATR